MAGLKPDEIKWILSLDASDTQKSINELNKENKDLTASNKELRAAMLDLEKQGKKESEEWNNLSASYKQNSDAIAINKQKISEHQKALSVNDMTMKQLRTTAKDLQNQLDNTVQSANPEQYAALEDQLDKVKNRMSELKGGGESFQGVLSSLPGPMGASAAGASNLGKSLYALALNPVVAVLTGLALVIMGLVKSFKEFANSSEEASARTAKALGPLKVLGNAIGDVFEFVGEKIVAVFESISTGFQSTVDFLNSKFGWFDDLNTKLKRQNEIEEENYNIQQKRKNIVVEQKQAEADMLALRLKIAQKDKYSAQERNQFVEEYLKRENELKAKTVELKQEELALEQAKAAQDDNSYEDNLRLKQLEADVIQAQIDSTNNLAAIDKRRQGLLKEMDGEVTASAKTHKEVMESKISVVDAYVKTEQSLLKEQYASGELEKAIYLKKLEELELDAFRRKLALYGLDAEKRQEYEDKILDYKIKMMEQLKQLESKGIVEKDDKENPSKQKIAQEKKTNAELKKLYNKNVADQKVAFKHQTEEINKYQGVAMGAADAFGTMIGGFISGSEDAAAQFGYSMLMLGLDTLRQVVLMASVELFANMTAKLGPIAGPIAAAAGTALINGVFEGIKGSIKRPGTDGNSSGSSMPSTGGRGSTVGYSEGGYTGRGNIYEEAGVVHMEEYVVPAWEMKDPIAQGYVQKLEAIRQTRSSKNTLPLNHADGFLDGGFTGVNQNQKKQLNADNKLLTQLVSLLGKLDKDGVNISYSHLDASNKRVSSIRSRVSRK